MWDDLTGETDGRGCCSVTQSYPTFCDLMDFSTPGFPVPHPSPKVCPSLCQLHQWYHLARSSCNTVFTFYPQAFLASGTFAMSQLFTSDDQNTGTSASALVLQMSIQGWFPLRMTGLISLLSKGLSKVFSSTTVWRHQFFGVLPSFMVQLSQPYMTTGKTTALTLGTFVGSHVSTFQHTV